jgi:hypothetical protein
MECYDGMTYIELVISMCRHSKLFNKHVRLNAGRDSGQLKHIGETPCQYKTT